MAYPILDALRIYHINVIVCLGILFWLDCLCPHITGTISLILTRKY